MIKVTNKPFDALTLVELHNIFQLRNACFVVEQNAIYQELDGHDLTAIHCCYLDDDKLCGYLRFMPLDNNHIKLSRLCVSQAQRNQQIGTKLIKHALELSKLYGCHTVQLTAQKYLTSYYQSFGFKTCSTTYLINQIEHIDMALNINRAFI